MGEAVEEVKEAEDAGLRKRKRGAGAGVGSGGEEGDEEDEAGVEAAEGEGKDLLGEEEEEGARYEGIAEEDVMRWLELEIAGAAAPGGAAAGSVAVSGIDGESCGPSFSAAASTVMASFDTRAGAPPPPRVPWPWPERIVVKDVGGAAGTTTQQQQAAGDAVEMEMGPGGGEGDEEWLARLLTCGGPLLEGVL
nr:unnamed protein product [Digitaria exilis]